MLIDDPIPVLDFPEDCFSSEFVNEDLVSVTDYFNGDIIVDPVYHNSGLPGTFGDCMLRSSVAERLGCALELLPNGLTFKVYDSWRSVRTQKALYDSYFESLQKKLPQLSWEELEAETKKFVSPPSTDEDFPAVHNTGGAVDLTLFDTKNGIELDMGTDFDDFTVMAYTRYFEENPYNITARNNRRMLYYCMISAGFTNLPTEWWHYDFGDKFWAYYTGMPAMYKGIIDKEV